MAHKSTELVHQKKSIQLLAAMLPEAHQFHGPEAVKQWVKAKYPDAIVKQDAENLEVQYIRLHLTGDTLDRVEPLSAGSPRDIGRLHQAPYRLLCHMAHRGQLPCFKNDHRILSNLAEVH